jgi:hypothetical protein
MSIPISYNDDWRVIERMLMDVVERHTIKITDLGEEAIKALEKRYVMQRSDMKPRVFLRMTDNWIELTVRFLAEDHGVRDLKDAIGREMLTGMKNAGIGVASTTFEIVGLPPLRLERAPQTRSR